MKTGRKVLKQFRLRRELVADIKSEAARGKQTQTAIVELALGHYMALKGSARGHPKARPHVSN